MNQDEAKQPITLSMQQLWEIATEITETSKKFALADPASCKNVMWQQFPEDWVNLIEDKGKKTIERIKVSDKLVADWEAFAKKQKERNDKLESEFETHLESLDAALSRVKELETDTGLMLLRLNEMLPLDHPIRKDSTFQRLNKQLENQNK